MSFLDVSGSESVSGRMYAVLSLRIIVLDDTHNTVQLRVQEHPESVCVSSGGVMVAMPAMESGLLPGSRARRKIGDMRDGQSSSTGHVRKKNSPL